MIAKLIVKAETRLLALQKLRAALEEYEVVGMSTNIDFLKRCASHPAFIAGDVETGFIEKHREDLFHRTPTPKEVFAQAALGLLLNDSLMSTTSDPFSALGGELGFGGPNLGIQSRKVTLTEKHGEEVASFDVNIVQTDQAKFNIVVSSRDSEAVTYNDVSIEFVKNQPKKLTVFYPHTRIESTIVRADDAVTVFLRGTQYNLVVPRPSWYEKALGVKDLTHSVVAPMPCKVLRISVKEGQQVEKDDPLLVIESMKVSH